MGLPLFFTYLKNKYVENLIIFLNKDKKLSCDNFFIDFNGLIHNSYSNSLERHLSKSYKVVTKDLWFDIFKDVVLKIEELVSIANPKQLLYLAIDGVCPRTKMNHQRARRFVSARDNVERNKTFDSNQISPGTLFMSELAEYLRNYISQRNWNFKVIFSDSLEAGEGEQKLIEYIRLNKNKNNIINGLDADLIMLSVASQDKRIRLLRENTLHIFTKCKYLVFDISKLKNSICEEFTKNIQEQYKIDKTRILSDWVFINTFIGNDFLPGIPGLEINKNGIDYLIDIYCENFKGDYLIDPKNLEKTNKLFLKNILKDLDEILTIDNAVRIEDINASAEDYMKILIWNKYYYFGKCVSYTWFYSNHFPPPLSKFVKYLESIDNISFTFDYNPPVEPITQLLCILPQSSIQIIPEKYRCVFTSSVLNKYFPKEFKIDIRGKKFEYQGKVLIPFIDLKLVSEMIEFL